jgi:hypothetical protein
MVEKNGKTGVTIPVPANSTTDSISCQKIENDREFTS